MMLNYQLPLFRYSFSFFEDEIAHLMIAVQEYIPPYVFQRQPKHHKSPVFEKTSAGRVLKSLQQAESWELGADIARRAGMAKKSLANHFAKLGELGHTVESRRSRHGKEYRLKK